MAFPEIEVIHSKVCRLFAQETGVFNYCFIKKPAGFHRRVSPNRSVKGLFGVTRFELGSSLLPLGLFSWIKLVQIPFVVI